MGDLQRRASRLSTFVVDASVVVSAALVPGGTPRQALLAASSHGTIALSSAVYDEIAEVLQRPKFARVLSADRRTEILELLTAAAIWIEPRHGVEYCRDAKDNKYLKLALAVSAAAIVSGDEDLLVLNPWRGIRVLRAAEFLGWLAGSP